MGESAERMATINKISREAQDHFAERSHQRAAQGWEDGVLAAEVAPVTTKDGKVVSKDTVLRPGTSVDKLAKLRPVFAEDGTLTAGNSSALTDGSAAVLLMSEKKARELEYKALAHLTSWAYVGVDPADQLLMGPAIAMPLALQRAQLTLEDVDIFDMHEAFAAQVLSVLSMLESDSFAQERLGQDTAFGTIEHDKLNLYGGSLALGHPFGATGARMVTTMAYELERSQKQVALLGLCAAGGLGAGAVMTRVD
jgi:acetyl-CoA acyltransferase